MDDNGDAINQQNGIKSKAKLFYDNLKQFHYKNQIPIMNHLFICYILNDNIIFLTGSERSNHEDCNGMKCELKMKS